MDFAAQLANLQRSAEAARRRPADRNDRSDGDRPRQRQRQEEQESASPPFRSPPGTTSTRTAGTSTPPPPPHSNKKPIPFQSLQRAGYRIESKVLHVKQQQQQQQPQQQSVRVRHICLLAVIIDGLPYEDLWKCWANTNSMDSNRSNSRNENGETTTTTIVSLVCHAKFPYKIQSDFVKQHLLQQPPQVGRGTQLAPPEFRSHRPEWGSIEILRAMLDILHDGLQVGLEPSITDERYHPKRYLMTPTPGVAMKAANADSAAAVSEASTSLPPADMFVFISESCIPIQPLSHWIRHLDATRSWVNARHRTMPGTPRNKYELDQFAMMKLVPGECRWKADQWMALCRSHAIAVREIDNHLLERDRLWCRAFQHVNASDEMYFPTALAILQLLKPDNNEEQQPQQQQQPQPQPQQKLDQNESSSSSANNTTAATTTNASDGVEKRPVTYTDWSQGMKNPASFTKKDLRAVVDKARAQGCLIARKFTGDISPTDWEPICNAVGPVEK